MTASVIAAGLASGAILPASAVAVQYTGCLTGAAGEEGGGGTILRVKIGTTPLKPCTGNQTLITWNSGGGTQGPIGPIGPIGPKGDTGAPGEKGDTGTPGTNGTNGTNGLDGLKGDTGTPGTNGTNGTNGLDGLKGDTGLQGQMGANGAMGLKGDTGAPGEKGDTGTPGTNGTNGLDGLKGDTGAPGPQGAPGTANTYFVAGITKPANNDGSSLVTLASLPVGNYLIVGQVTTTTTTNNRSGTCRIAVGTTASWSLANSGSTVIAPIFIGQVSGGTVSIVCSTTPAGQVDQQGTLTAIKVGP